MPALILPSWFTSQPQRTVEITPEWGDVEFCLVGSSIVAQYKGNGVLPSTVGLTTPTDTGIAVTNVAFSNALYKLLLRGGPRTILGMSRLTGTMDASQYASVCSGTQYGSADRNGVELGLSGAVGSGQVHRLYAVPRTNDATSNGNILVAPSTTTIGTWYTYAYRMDGFGNHRLDSRQLGSASGTYLGSPTSNSVDTFNVSSSYASTGIQTPVLVIFPRYLSYGEVKAFEDNPWQLFRATPSILYFDVGGTAAALDGSATAQSTAAGALTTSIPVTAAAAVVATASGALSTAILLSGQAASASVVGGVLTTTITLSGSALSEAIAQAALSTDIKINGTAGTEASSSGELTTGSILTGSAGVVASSVASLTTNISLSGAAISQVIAAANLTDTPLGLSGDATVQASATGELLTDIPLIGSAQAYSTVIGGLTTIIPLSGAAASVADATGNLTLETTLSGASIALALAGGNLTTVIRLDGTAIARAAAIGLLSTPATEPVTPPCRIIMVKSDARVIQIQKELRAMLIPIDRRTIPVSRC